MKYLLVLLFLASCSQSPKFKVGDCVTLNVVEEWEHNDFERIREIGKEKYRTTYSTMGTPQISVPSFIRIGHEDSYITIECPVEPHEFDKLQWKEPRPR